MKIILLNNSGKSWHRIDQHFVKGFAFINDRHLSHRELVYELIQSIENDHNLDQKLSLLNGNFSVVIVNEKGTYLIADKIKTYPLLYANLNDDWIITDQAKVIMEEVPAYSPDKIAIMTYLALGYVHGNQTFLNNCKIVSAGSYVKINEEVQVFEYHKHIYDKNNLSKDEIYKSTVRSLDNAFKRMLLTIGNRPVWIPLSGGYDSRLIACLCKKYDIRNVRCYTYGIPESHEIETSKSVADTLGFPWHYVQYDKDKILSLLKDPICKNYMLWAMNLNSTPHIQDLLAIKELKENRILEDDAIIIPGHKVSILSEGKLPVRILKTEKSVAEIIFDQNFFWNILRRKYKKQVLKNLGIELNSISSNNNHLVTCDLYTNWLIKNRLSNYITNSVRVYEYFGVDWRIPLWDDEFARLWNSIPIKIDEKPVFNDYLFNKIRFDEYFVPFHVSFKKDNNYLKDKAAIIKLPFGFKERLKSYSYRFKTVRGIYDPNGFSFAVPYYLKTIKDYRLDYLATKKLASNSLAAIYTIEMLEEFFKNR
jgi:asparagine synthase (glutamine-hydrolysing)